MQTLDHTTETVSRALFGARRAEVSNTVFEGEEALNRAGELTLSDSIFAAPRPLAHVTDAIIRTCTFHESAVSPLEGARTVTLQNCVIDAPHGCEMARDISLDACRIRSAAFGTDAGSVLLTDTLLTGDNVLHHAQDVTASNLELTGTRAFCKTNGGTIDFSTLTGDEMLFGAQNITISDTVLEGERIGWYSEGLTLNHCVICGSRPFAFAKKLTLVDCALDSSCAHAFERSEVDATLRGTVPSVYNPAHGTILADAYGEVVFDDTAVVGTDCAVKTRD